MIQRSHCTGRAPADSRGAFLLVHNDGYERIRTAASGMPESLAVPAGCDLAGFLGLDAAALCAFPSASAPLFVRPKLFDGGAGAGFLTTAVLAALLHDQGRPFIAVGERALAAWTPPLEPLLAAGISTTHTFDVASLCTTVARLRAILPGVPVVLGGAGAT